MSKRNGRVTPEEFIRAWQKGDTVQGIADACGISKQAASARTQRYRSIGIPLKVMRKRNPPLDAKSLAALAKSLAKD